MCRRTIVRNACLAQCLVLRDISVRIRKRFPTMNSLVEAGISVLNYFRDKAL